MFFLYLLKEITSRDTSSEKPIAVTPGIKCQSSIRVNRVSRRSQSFEKQVREKEKRLDILQFLPVFSLCQVSKQFQKDDALQ